MAYMLALNRGRKNLELRWLCEIHEEPMRFFCKFHKVVLCPSCAFLVHEFIPCQLEDVNDLITELEDEFERRRCPNGIKGKQGTESTLCEYLSQWNQKSKRMDNADFCDERLARERQKEREEVRHINKRAEEEMRKIKAEKELLLRECHVDAEMRRAVISEFKIKMRSEGRNMSTRSNANVPMFRTVGWEMGNDPNDKLENIIIVKTEQKTNNRFEKWAEVDQIPVPSVIGNPIVVGLIGDHELVIKDGSNHDTFVINVERKKSKKVASGEGSMSIISCAFVPPKYIVCGMLQPPMKGWRNLIRGRIRQRFRLYDSQWNRINDTTITNSSLIFGSRVCVDVNENGKILAAETGDTSLYVINPNNGAIVETIRLGKAVLNRVQSVPSGDLIAATGDTEITIFSRSGVVKTSYVDDHWTLIACRVVRLTGAFYVLDIDADKGDGTYTVYELTYSGRIYCKEILRFPSAHRRQRFGFSPAYPTCGRLVCCDGNMIRIFKKTFSI